MKRSVRPLFIGLASSFFLTAGIFAQEKTEVTVQIKKDGKIVKDTTYRFDSEADAIQSLKIWEVMEGEGDDNNTMVFVSKDGEKTEIKHMKGDSLMWVSEGDHPGGEHVVVVTSGEGGTYEVLVDDGEGDVPVKVEKRVKVIVTDEEKINSDQEVYVISGEDAEKELKEILEKVKEEDGKKEMKVIVIKKEK